VHVVKGHVTRLAWALTVGPGRAVKHRVLFIVAAITITFGPLSGCASIAAYEASHPYYRFPVTGCGGCGAGG
jgi:hypothetical protein